MLWVAWDRKGDVAGQAGVVVAVYKVSTISGLKTT